MKLADDTAEDEQERIAFGILDDAIARLKRAGHGETFIAHVLVSSGLLVMGSTLCANHLIDALQFVSEVVTERIADTRKEMN
jgi:hypothetical protein